MEPKFKYYEIVKIISPRSDLAKYKGKQGVVLGLSEYPPSNYSYGIYFDEMGETVMVAGENIATTGQFCKREDIYEDSVKIHVDPLTGRGLIK